MINYDLSKIRAIVFDVDGVLSSSTVPTDGEGEPLRTVNIKDGYAIQLASKMGMHIGIITGGRSAAIENRYRRLGVDDIFMGCAVKIETWNGFLEGDDIPDYEVMLAAGSPCCPRAACSDIKAISVYVSNMDGGQGCGRDIIEQVLRAQGKWLSNAKAFGW